MLESVTPSAAAALARAAESARADAEYLDGIAKSKIDECHATYDLILARREAAVPVILKALDLYADPAKAPHPKTAILTGALSVWGGVAAAQPTYLRVYMASLRRKLEPDPAHPRYLLTVHGAGYRFADA